MAVRFTGPFLPAVNVNEKDAMDYCDWLNHHAPNGGKWRLPTEAEWLLSATGGSIDRLFPWGKEIPTPRHSNHHAHYFGPTVVGAFHEGVSPTGCDDIAGNVWEWCSDKSLHGTAHRITKGGSYRSSPESLELKSFKSQLFGGRFEDVGFRVIHERNK
jgi:formylglycine-generating enzyme required for sulfatase activity